MLPQTLFFFLDPVGSSLGKGDLLTCTLLQLFFLDPHFPHICTLILYRLVFIMTLSKLFLKAGR